MAKPDYQSPDYLRRARQWRVMRDAIEGVDAIKDRGVAYLPYPQPVLPSDSPDVAAEKEARYADYKARANFVNATTRTHDGLNGAIHRLPPTIALTSRIEYLEESTDGGGLPLAGMAKAITGELLAVGRVGLLADYPQAPEGATADITAGLQATIATYPAEAIINWRETIMAGRKLLTLVVLLEADFREDSDFGGEYKAQYRVLRLEDGVYTQALYDSTGDLIEGPFAPRDGQGRTFDQIPFTFAGAYNNAAATDVPPLYDLAQLNIGHYRNSADFEEACFIAGQPTLFLSSEMTSDEFTRANPSGVRIGSRSGHFLGKGGNAVMLQANETNMARQAMQDKEQQMLMIGAKLVRDAGGTETAEAARIRASGEVSVLSTLVSNASAAVRQCLAWCDRFMGGNGEGIEFAINDEFFADTVTGQDIASMMGLVDAGHISQADLRSKLRKAGWVAPGRSDEEIDADIINAMSLTNGGGETGEDA